jgi:predicted ribosomally synthesized peptide with nif11-like leader
MSEQQLNAFLAAVKSDAGLQEKINAATDSDAVVAIAHAAGFLISADAITESYVFPEGLSDSELEGVAGGASHRAMINGRDGCI